MINGDRIRQAREIRGWTQTELARRIRVNQSAIAQFEGGMATPSPERLEAIALQTGFPISFFKQGPAVDFPLGSLLFRARASMSSVDKNKVRQYGRLIYEAAEKMEASLKKVPLRLPRQNSDPVTAARITRSALGLSPDTPLELLIRPLEMAGVLVLALPMPVDDYDAFSVWVGKEVSRPVIVFSTHGPSDRCRFNIAHEVGHLVVHTVIDREVKLMDKEANRFAAEFLMPEVSVAQELVPPVTLLSLKSLALRWRVSVQALMMRAYDLNIISLRQYKYLNQQISTMGLRKKSLVNLPEERPRAMRQIAEMLYGDPIDYRRMAADLSLPLPLVLEAFGRYAEKNKLLYPPDLPKEGNGQVVEFTVKKER